MPPRRQPAKKTGGAPKTKGAPRGMSKPIEHGLVLVDLTKKQWKLGPVIGQGGFGFIYLGDLSTTSQVTATNANYVIKVEPHANGPLFVELAFYQRVAKADMVNSWAKAKSKNHIGIPVYIGTGSFEHENVKYRFMVMDRFGDDVEKLYKACDYKFPEKTVYSLGLRILDTLEYIHDNEYVHADIKSSNLMMGFKKASETKMYLLDYGLAYRYCPNGRHVPYKEDPKRKHDGTIEYTSRDAHKGLAPSRRGDLEILGYCMVQWLCQKLPWEDKLTDKEYVAKEKIKFMKDIPNFMKVCFDGDVPVYLQEYLHLVTNLEYDEKPDYSKIRVMFTKGLKKCGFSDDGISVCLPDSSAPQKKARKRAGEDFSTQRKRSREVVSAPKISKKVSTSEVTSTLSPRKVLMKTETRSPCRTGTRSSARVINEPSTCNLNGMHISERVVHRRPRRRNVPTRDFGQSP